MTVNSQKLLFKHEKDILEGQLASKEAFYQEACLALLDAEKKLAGLLEEHANLRNEYMLIATEKPKLVMNIRDEQEHSKALNKKTIDAVAQAEKLSQDLLDLMAENEQKTLQIKILHGEIEVIEKSHQELVESIKQELESFKAPYDLLLVQNAMAGEDIRSQAYATYDLSVKRQE